MTQRLPQPEIEVPGVTFEIVDQDRARVTVKALDVPALILHVLVALPILAALPAGILALSNTVSSYSAPAALTAGLVLGVPCLVLFRHVVTVLIEHLYDRVIEICLRSQLLTVKTFGRPLQVQLSDIACVHVGSYGRYTDLYISDVFVVLRKRHRPIPILRFRHTTTSSEESAQNSLAPIAAWIGKVAECEVGEPRRVSFFHMG